MYILTDYVCIYVCVCMYVQQNLNYLSSMVSSGACNFESARNFYYNYVCILRACAELQRHPLEPFEDRVSIWEGMSMEPTIIGSLANSS